MEDETIRSEIRRLDAVIDERDRLYMALFSKSEQAVNLALSAKTASGESRQWSVGTLIALLALAAAIFAAVRR